MKSALREKARSGRDRRSLLTSLLTEGEIRFGVARHSHRLGLVLGAFVPTG
jgi:hypothetical protein